MLDTGLMELTEHAQRNREHWDSQAHEWVESGRRAWASNDPAWGVWSVPESELRVLDDLVGKDVLEAGCGTAYWSSWVARRGGRAVGLDNSPKQLETARSLQKEHGVEFPLRLGTAEDMPFEDASFDIVFSEYGASIWCDPYLWVPEAVRVLRPSGQLAFLVNSLLSILCAPETETPPTNVLLRPQFGMHRFEWPDDGSVEFHLPHGEWIRLLRDLGMDVEALIEVQAPADAKPHRFIGLPQPEWGRKWPVEEIWKARKRQ
jgi:SAM-dependent methyltransferase